MVAKPYLNKIVKLKNLPKDGGSSTDNDVTYEVKLDDINIREAISRPLVYASTAAHGLQIPGYCRFTIALEESNLNGHWIALLNSKISSVPESL